MSSTALRTDRKLPRREFIKHVAAAGISSTLLSCAGSVGSIQTRSRFDLLIRSGMIIDGTGADTTHADIGIREGHIVATGNLADSSADRTIDASGMIVTPGFIDIHSHVDSRILASPQAESKVRQGVTTEVVGADGDSMAPRAGHMLQEQMQGFRRSHGFDLPYRDIDGFLKEVRTRGSAQNILTFVGLGTIRECIVGMENRLASADEMLRMKTEVAKAIEQGCFGASTGLEYTPGSFASTEELTELMRAVPERHRLYSTHLRNEDNTLLEAIEEAIAICRESGARLQVSHLKASYRINWHKQARALEMLDHAIDEGIEVHADRYPYIAYATGLAALFPLWSRAGGTEQFLARLKNDEELSRIRPEVLNKVNGLGSWNAVMISSARKDSHKGYLGKTVEEIASEIFADPFDLVVDLLQSENGDVGMVGFGMNEEGTEMVLQWKNTIISSDAGAYSPSSPSRPHPRAYGTFPRAIAHYQRERRLTTLPEMIRKMTSLPAQKVGLRDRGTLRQGNWADVVVFDYETIHDRATFVNPHRYPDGIEFVIVNGAVVVDKNVQTSALPGHVVRSS